MMRKLLAGIGLLLCLSLSAQAQSTCPYIVYGAVLTPAQWQSCFTSKADATGAPFLPLSGGTMTGLLTTATPTAALAGLNLPAGTAPTSPNNGDIWTTLSGLYVQINGTTIGPLTEGTTGSFAATEPITVAATGGVVTYGFDYSHAGTFTAQQIDNGLTTTSPGWYAGITGDTYSRVRIGLNSTDVASVAFGAGGSSVRDTFLERAGAAQLRLGAPDAAAPVAQTLSVQNVVAGTYNTDGANLTIDLSQSTGAAYGGGLAINASPAGSAGTSQNALVKVLDYGVTTLGAWTVAKPITLSAALTYGVAAGTSLALGGATIGSNALAVTGTSALGNTTIGAGSAITSSGAGGALTALAYTSPGTGVATALGNTVNATGGMLTYGLIGTSGATLCLLNANCAFSGATVAVTQTLSDNSTLLATDAFVQGNIAAISAGFEFKNAVTAATTANLNATYVNGVSGVGATLTNAGSLVAFSVDGQSPSSGARVLIKNQSTAYQNGIYTVTTVGSGAVAWILTRATDYNSASQILPGDLVPVENGTANGQSIWLQTATVNTIGTDSISFSEYVYPPSTFLQVANNLSDLNSTSTARTNLGLGTAATQNTGTSSATIPLLNGNNTYSGTANFTSTFQIGGNTVVARGTNLAFGAVEGDGTTITCVVGVCTALGASAYSIDAGGETAISNGKINDYLFDEAGNVGHSGFPYMSTASMAGAL